MSKEATKVYYFILGLGAVIIIFAAIKEFNNQTTTNTNANVIDFSKQEATSSV